ncbi:hypothetical protein KEM55_008874 [Ascosphaera atra]|nr:hypothetical protein KEM55_008874 [Ascosphaera atra]
MFDFEASGDLEREICRTTVGSLPLFIDPKQPPKKQTPFSTVQRHPFIHNHAVTSLERDADDVLKVQLLLPQEDYDAAWDARLRSIATCQYAKATMPIASLLEGDFFNKYIKTGNVIMISEGRPGVDNVYSLADGILRLEMDKSVYERVGLVGKAVKSGGRKHIKERYLIEINLPPEPDYSPEAPISRHRPQFLTVEPSISTRPNVLIPPLDPACPSYGASATPLSDTDASKRPSQPVGNGTDRRALERQNQELFNQACDELQEWLALIALNSPRVSADDDIDPYLSRYSPPVSKNECVAGDLVHVEWRGMMPAAWILRLFIALTRAVDNENGYTLLVQPAMTKREESTTNARENEDPEQTQKKGSAASGRRYIAWEYAGGVGCF